MNFVDCIIGLTDLKFILEDDDGHVMFDRLALSRKEIQYGLCWVGLQLQAKGLL